MKFIVVVRGKLKDTDPKKAQAGHDAAVAKLSVIGRPLGDVGHQPYLNPQNPQEFLAVDTWDNIEGMQKFMNDPNVAAEFGKLFEGMPDISVWAESGWSAF
ncbi:MAG: hypothetical protein HYZ49_06295 [Chloroflexi bacterium]|nr:hypothetical protein [Chloroflexota bacterium]